MKTFEEYLTEAKFSQMNMEKVVSLVNRVVSRKVGKQFYRHGGDGGIQPLDRGAAGYLFYATDRHAYQIVYHQGMIRALYVWRQWEMQKSPEFFVNLEGINIVQVVNAIADIIKKPKIGDVHQVNESELLEGEFITEAKRISHQEFIKLVKLQLDDISNIEKNQLVDIAKIYDVSVPGSVLRLGVATGKGRSAKTFFDLTKGPSASAPTKSGKSSEYDPKSPILYVLGRGSKGQMFKPSAEQIEKALEKEIKSRMDPDHLPDKDERSDPDTMFGHLTNLIKVVIKGGQPSLLVYGGPGIGKTFTVNATIKELGLQRGSDWDLMKGKTSPFGLYETLFLNRNILTVFDDIDSVFSSEETRNILKAALDSDKVKEISWQSGNTQNVSKYNEEELEEFMAATEEKINNGEKYKLPSRFPFAGKVIFISNLPESKIEPAILSRSFKIDMTLTDEGLFKRLASILEFIGNDDEDLQRLNMDEKREILAELHKMNKLGDYRNPTMRGFLSAARIYLSGAPNWQEMMKYS